MKANTVERINTELRQLETLANIVEDIHPTVALFIRSEVVSIRDLLIMDLISEEVK